MKVLWMGVPDLKLPNPTSINLTELCNLIQSEIYLKYIWITKSNILTHDTQLS